MGPFEHGLTLVKQDQLTWGRFLTVCLYILKGSFETGYSLKLHLNNKHRLKESESNEYVEFILCKFNKISGERSNQAYSFLEKSSYGGPEVPFITNHST